MMATGLERFQKKWGSAVKRTKKQAKKAVEDRLLREAQERRMMEETPEDRMKREGAVNFETNEVVDYHEAYHDDEVMGFMTKSFYKKLENDLKINAEVEAMKKMEQLIEGIENRIVEKLMGEKVKLAELEIRKLELQVELARLEAAKTISQEPIEFELTPFIKEEKEVVEKPKKMRKAKVVVAKAESMISTPIRKTRSGYSVSWRQAMEKGIFMDAFYNILAFADENGIDVADTEQFRQFHSVCQGAYLHYIKMNSGRKGCWKELAEQYKASK